MKKIKVKIVGHPLTDTFGYSYFILNLLKKNYNVELSENPDYLFYNESMLDHYKYDCIKIFYTGENYTPDFNQCDYAVGFDHMQFEDRYYRLPLYLLTVFYNTDELLIAGKDYLKNKQNFTNEDLKKKTDFCSFVYSNYRSDNNRKRLFDKISEYKKVNSGGAYLNNTGDRIKNKLEFEMKHKFSIACENSSRSGYVTEKIVGSMVANTVPIYWGNPNVAKEFNTKRFINCHDYESLDEVIKKIKELDENDDLYIKTINEPYFVDGYNYEKIKSDVDIFLKNIINQPIDKAKRKTINPIKSLELKENEKIISVYISIKTSIKKILAFFYKPFKKIPFLEKVKQNYFSVK